MMPKDKTLKISGKVEVAVEGNRLIITATEGLSVANLADTAGNVLWVYHPLSGWYIELDMRKSGK